MVISWETDRFVVKLVKIGSGRGWVVWGWVVKFGSKMIVGIRIAVVEIGIVVVRIDVGGACKDSQ